MNKGGLHLQAERLDPPGLMGLGAGIFLGMQYNLGELAQIRQERRTSYIILRHYDPDTMAMAAGQRAQEHFTSLTTPSGGVTPHEVIDLFIPLNEQNLALEHPSDSRLMPHPTGSGVTYSLWETREGIEARDRWMVEYQAAFRELCRQAGITIPLGGPAESPGHDVYDGSVSQGPESEYACQAGSLAGWDVWVAHCYGDPAHEWTGGRWRKTLAKMREVTGASKPFIITEFNDGDFVALLQGMEAEPAVLGACWFLWAETDPAFQSMAFIRMGEQRQRLTVYLAQQPDREAPKLSTAPDVAEPLDVTKPPEVTRPADVTPGAQGPEFKAGFQDLAERLGRDVVGEPLENEFNLDAAHALQTTTKGLLWYRAGGQPMFLPAYPLDRPGPASTPTRVPSTVISLSKGVDVSNYSGRLTPAQIVGLKNEGYAFLIAGTQDRGICRQQLQMALDHGLFVEAYVYLYWDDVPGRVQRAIETVKGLAVRRLWLDVEESGSAPTHAQTLEAIRAGADACERAGMPWGIYTSRSKWLALTGDSHAFADAPLWDARYDGEPSFDYFQPYGGWTAAACKQYAGDVQVSGVHADLNVAFPA